LGNIDVTIRPAREEDREAVGRVILAARLDTYPNTILGITPQLLRENFAKPKARKSLRPTDALLVAEQAGEVVAMAHFEMVYPKRQRVYAFHVAPEAQNQGIGKMLWEVVLADFCPRLAIILYVVRYNERAINFWSNRGFDFTGKADNNSLMLGDGIAIPLLEMRREGK
jgi:ribosomal protein S18 acetylase RimI-like enzyme